MQRPLPEVMASQDEMLRRRGNFDPGEDNSVVARAFQDHLSDVYGWLNGKPHVKVNRVQYHAVLREPKADGGDGGEVFGSPAGRRGHGKAGGRNSVPPAPQIVGCALWPVLVWPRATRPRAHSAFARRKLKTDLALRRSFGNHEFLDGFDDVLNCGVMGFQAAVQLVDFGGEQAVFGQHLAHAHESADHENAHLDGPLRN